MLVVRPSKCFLARATRCCERIKRDRDEIGLMRLSARDGIAFREGTTFVIGHVSCIRWGKVSSISLYVQQMEPVEISFTIRKERES